MRIVAGAWRGRALVAPPGQGTRPTADRTRQALFDTLMHAAWGGRAMIEGAVVLDVFAGTGALGLEALSRGAASACFIESDSAALGSLRANVKACKAEGRTQILAANALTIPPIPWRSAGYAPSTSASQRAAHSAIAASVVFLDPPYSQNLVPRALARLTNVGCLQPDALIVAEIARADGWMPDRPVLNERQHGAARVVIFRLG